MAAVTLLPGAVDTQRCFSETSTNIRTLGEWRCHRGVSRTQSHTCVPGVYPRFALCSQWQMCPKKKKKACRFVLSLCFFFFLERPEITDVGKVCMGISHTHNPSCSYCFLSLAPTKSFFMPELCRNEAKNEFIKTQNFLQYLHQGIKFNFWAACSVS